MADTPDCSAALPMLTGAGTGAIALVVMCVEASVSHAIAFFGDGLGQGFAGLGAVNVNALGGAVDADLGLRVKLLHCVFDGAFAMAAGHARDGESLVHGSLSLC